MSSGLEEAISHAFDISSWEERGVDLHKLDIVIVAEARDPEESILPPEIYPALVSARDRFSRLFRRILFVRSRYQPVGRASHRDLKWLPLQAPGDDPALLEAFDLIVLMDETNTQGLSITKTEDAVGRCADVILQLTLSDIAPLLQRQFQNVQAQTGIGGRYVSIGLTELHFDPGFARVAIGDLLYNRMAREILVDSQPPAAAPTPAKDIWGQETTQRLEKLSDQDNWLVVTDQIDKDRQQSLQSVFKTSTFELAALQSSLARRVRASKDLTDRMTLRLATFMNEFVPWYIRHRLKSEPPKPKGPTERIEWVFSRRRIAFLVVTFVTTLVCAGLFPGYGLGSPEGKLLATLGALGLLGMIIQLILGLKTKNVFPIAIPVIRNLLDELDDHRGRRTAASELLRHYEQSSRAVENNSKILRARARKQIQPQLRTLPFPDKARDLLLQRNSIDPQTEVFTFWRSAPNPVLLAMTEGSGSLPATLRDYALKRCSIFKDVNWNDVLKLIGGPQALDQPELKNTFDWAQKISQPWMPIPGAVTHVALGLPRTLSQEVCKRIVDRFETAVHVELRDEDRITILQWTQGYEVALAPTDSSQAGPI